MLLRDEIVQTEAMRIARKLIKDDLRSQKVKISYVNASDIDKAARRLLKEDPSIYVQARKQARRLINP